MLSEPPIPTEIATTIRSAMRSLLVGRRASRMNPIAAGSRIPWSKIVALRV
jgi:hypothetical protein